MSCLTTDLTPYVDSSEMPWTLERVMHLFRKTGFGINASEAKANLIREPQEVINELLSAGFNALAINRPDWVGLSYQYYRENQEKLGEHYQDWISIIIQDMIDHPIRAKMALFWHDHFVTNLENYICPTYLYNYYQILNGYAFGNFKEFVLNIGESEAMLIYLNGYENKKGQANENYARELFELFTLGRDKGYTEQDITEAARALTGYNHFIEFCKAISFTPNTHDASDKTIFGVTDNFNHASLIDIIFEKRKRIVADFITSKIFLFLTGIEPTEEIREDLILTFINSAFSIKEVYGKIVRSQAFFDEACMYSDIKAPLEFILHLVRTLDFTLPAIGNLYVYYQSSNLGQILFQPPSVEGWNQGKNWIDTSLITVRWETSDLILSARYNENKNYFKELATSIIPETTDPYLFTVLCVDYFIPGGFPEEARYEEATQIFKANIPENYYRNNLWNLEWETVPDQVALLLSYILKSPEYQLK